MSVPDPDPSEVITCRVTTWYYRRMGLLAAMFLGMGLYFLYDGKIGYPAENRIVETKAWFEQVVINGPEGFKDARDRGEASLESWLKSAREKGWIVSAALKEPKWEDYAAPHGWASSPERHSPEAIEQQFWFGGAMVLGAVIAGVLVLFNHNRTFAGHSDHMVMPGGTIVRYASVIRVDKRKWDNKGLAHVHYREADGAATRRVMIDDLKFGGAGRVLDRLLTHFSGELVEKSPDADEAATSDDQPSVRPPEGSA